MIGRPHGCCACGVDITSGECVLVMLRVVPGRLWISLSSSAISMSFLCLVCSPLS